jgi:WD40 repeat protein
VDRIGLSTGGARLALHNAKTASLEIWDIALRKSIWSLRGTDSQVAAFALSPDSSRLATASMDNVVRLWNAATGHALDVSARLSAPVTFLAFTADGARLVTGSSDHAVAVWESGSLRRIQSVKLADAPGVGSGAILSVAYSPDGKRIALSAEGSGNVSVWDAVSGQLLSLLKGHAAAVDALAYSPDGSRIVSGSRDKTLRVWDAATFDPLLVMGDHDEAIASLVFSPDGQRIYSASPDGTVRVWETRMMADSE